MSARRPLAVGLGVLSLALLLAGCGGTPASVSSDSPAPAQILAPLTSPATGVVIAVDSAGLGSVRGFTLRLADGRTQVFQLGTLEDGADFAPGHLKEHAVTAAPVRAFFRQEGGALVVYRLEDGS